MRDTAAPYAAALSIDPIVDSRLREVNVGDWAGRTFDDVAAVESETVDAAAAGHDVRRGGGETFAETRARVAEGLDDLVVRASTDTDRPVLVVFTHGGPIRVAAAEALGLPSPGHARLGPPSNCSVTTLEYDGDVRRLLRYNRPTVVGVSAVRNVREHEMAGLT